MAKPIVALETLKAHLGVSHSLDDALIERFGAAAVDVALGELGVAQSPGDPEPAAWATLLDPVPDWFAVAVGFITCHFYENRSDVVIGQGISAIQLPKASTSILHQHRENFFV